MHIKIGEKGEIAQRAVGYLGRVKLFERKIKAFVSEAQRSVDVI